MTEAPHHKPLSAAAFAASLAALHSSDHVGVAFSGGPDSLALLILAAQWAKRSRKRRVMALTIDHGLRAESAAEAELAGAMARRLGVMHEVLEWRGEKPSGDIQAAARHARYALLTQACRRHSIGSLLVAHHQEDQAETFLLRLARGSGVDGLAGMAASRALAPDVKLLRPLLDVPRDRLLAVVAKSGMTPLLDPSNVNERFARVRMRKAMPLLAELGLDATRLAETATRMGRAREALESICDNWMADHAMILPSGVVIADAGALVSVSAEIGLRLLARIVRDVAGADYAPRFDQLEAAFQALYEGSIGRGRTLAGVKLSLSGGRLIAIREASAAMKAPPLLLHPGESGVWDGRFLVALERAPGKRAVYAVRMLGAEAARQLVKLGHLPPEGPKLGWASCPALWQDGHLLAAPNFAMSAKAVAFKAVFKPERG